MTRNCRCRMLSENFNSFKHATSQHQLSLLVPEFELYGFSDSTEIGRRRPRGVSFAVLIVAPWVVDDAATESMGIGC
jgi:hypothetical protein